MDPIIESTEVGPPPFRLHLIDLMLLVGIVAGLLALARVDLMFGVIGCLVLAPVAVRAFRVIRARRASGMTQGVGVLAAEFARSLSFVLMSYLWIVTIFLIVSFLASFTLNILFLTAAGLVAMFDGRELTFSDSEMRGAMPGAILFGLVLGLVAAVVAFLRECVRFWRISDELPGDPRPPRRWDGRLNRGPPW